MSNPLLDVRPVMQGGFLKIDLSLDELEQLHKRGEITILSATKSLVTLRVVLSKDYEVEHKKD